ncbi:unnamed protein product, partial [Prorocentrum cordatum]
MKLSNKRKAGRRADDFQITGPRDEVDELLEVMGERLKLPEVVKLAKTGGQATFLSVQVEHVEGGCAISGKTSLIYDVLKELGLDSAGPAVLRETKNEVNVENDVVKRGAAGHIRYGARVGKLLPLASHRPDVQRGVGALSWGTSGLTERGLGRLKKMSRRLAGARDCGMQLISDKGGIACQCWVDADWGRRRGAAEVLGLASLREEWQEKTVPCVMGDSSSASHIVKKRGPGKMKHVEIRFLALQQWGEQGRLRFGKVSTREKPSDMMTKSMPREKLGEFTSM